MKYKVERRLSISSINLMLSYKDLVRLPVIKGNVEICDFPRKIADSRGDLNTIFSYEK